MAEIINLRQSRKRRAREAARSKSDGNAARFGRTKAERDRATKEFSRETARLDGHEIDRVDRVDREYDGDDQ